MAIPVARGRTLRDIAAELGLNPDWQRLNSSGDESGNAYRSNFFGQLSGQYNPYGTMGATALDQFGRAGEVDVNMIPDDLSGQWGDIARRLGARDAPELRGMLGRGRGNELTSGDRGMYNEYAADLGNLVYDPALGWLPGEGGFQEGSRVGRSFRNMETWGPLAVAAVGMGMNGGLFGPGEAQTGAFDTGGWTGSGIDGSTGVTQGGFGGGGGGGFGGAGGASGTSGFYSPDTLSSMTQNPAGSFDMGGWSGTGINGNTGSSSFFGNLLSDPMGTLGNAASRAGEWALKNPMQALQLAGGLFGSQQQQQSGDGEQPWNPMQGAYDPGPAPRQPIYQPIVNGRQLNQDEYLRMIGYGRG